MYFAKFERREQQLFRLDTRIYLRDDDEPGVADCCVAAVVAKNPGSAVPTRHGELTALTLDGDKLIPTVRNRFIEAFNQSNTTIQPGSFIRIWNLLYICNPDLTSAINDFSSVSDPLWCETEETVPPIVWFAWGPPRRELDSYKTRFLRREYKHAFYYDIDQKNVVSEKPGALSRVKHTQGMPKKAIETHLANLLRQ